MCYVLCAICYLLRALSGLHKYSSTAGGRIKKLSRNALLHQGRVRPYAISLIRSFTEGIARVETTGSPASPSEVDVRVLTAHRSVHWAERRMRVRATHFR